MNKFGRIIFERKENNSSLPKFEKLIIIREEVNSSDSLYTPPISPTSKIHQSQTPCSNRENQDSTTFSSNSSDDYNMEDATPLSPRSLGTNTNNNLPDTKLTRPDIPQSEESQSKLPKNKYRFTLEEATPELLAKLNISEYSLHSPFASTLSSPATSLNGHVEATTANHVLASNHKMPTQSYHRSRKNPYPMRSPSKSSEGLSLNIDLFSVFSQDPQKLLQRDSDKPKSVSDTVSFSSSESLQNSPRIGPKRTRSHKPKNKRSSHAMPRESRRKANSLARVLADQGLIDSPFSSIEAPTSVNGEKKSVRLPPQPQIEFSQLMIELNNLGLDNDVLNSRPKIAWKGDPLSIEHLPHYEVLHPNESYIASTFRLTPIQFLNAKYTLISSSRRYKSRSLPFRKSDAQKLLRIDVNKASKLWEQIKNLHSEFPNKKKRKIRKF
ncbi:3905_t:CDS:2 [Ambispora gerdemannii]|uniref:3905_t:CDS:1 n=1 Tax=Ambispora gerdemannii TaxID=144530 RepID=A0A9N8W6V9_9GLOM|nr:3905_t:CDS:2 [Ambispora gerdemannii]